MKKVKLKIHANQLVGSIIKDVDYKLYKEFYEDVIEIDKELDSYIPMRKPFDDSFMKLLDRRIDKTCRKNHFVIYTNDGTRKELPEEVFELDFID